MDAHFNPEDFPDNVPHVILKELCSKLDNPNLFAFSFVSENVEDIVKNMNIQNGSIRLELDGENFKAAFLLGGSSVVFTFSNLTEDPTQMTVKYRDREHKVTNTSQWNTNGRNIRFYIDHGQKILNIGEIDVDFHDANEEHFKWLMKTVSGLKINRVSVYVRTHEQAERVIKLKPHCEFLKLRLFQETETEFNKCLERARTEKSNETEESFLEMLLNSSANVLLVSLEQPVSDMVETLTNRLIKGHDSLKTLRLVYEGDRFMSFERVLRQLKQFRIQDTIRNSNFSEKRRGVDVYYNDEPVLTFWWGYMLVDECCRQDFTFEIWQK